MAEITTTTTSFPYFLVSTILCATRLTLAASATDEPPYFCTIRAKSENQLLLVVEGSSILEYKINYLTKSPFPLID